MIIPHKSTSNDSYNMGKSKYNEWSIAGQKLPTKHLSMVAFLIFSVNSDVVYGFVVVWIFIKI